MTNLHRPLFILLAFLTVSGLFGQPPASTLQNSSLADNPDQTGSPAIPLKLGLKISPNLGWMNANTQGYSSDGIRFGGTIGFVSEIYFAEQYAVSTGFNFLFLNGKMHYQDNRLMGDTVEAGQVNRKYNIIYIEIPLMIKMCTRKFDKISYFGQIGLGTAFRIRARADEHFESASGQTLDQKYQFDSGTTLMRESILIGLGLQYHLDRSSRIVVGINYSNGLNNILKGVNNLTGESEKSNMNFVELNLGFLF